jgi:hypothetical protein
VARRYPAWYVELCVPVTLALAAYDWASAEAGLARAVAARPQLDPAAQEVLALILATQRFFLARYRDGEDSARLLWPGLRAQLSQALALPVHEPLRWRQFIIHRCQAAQLGWEPFTRAEADALLAQLAPAGRNQYVWHELAMHAYRQRWDDLLLQAYSELSITNDGLLGNWFYHHARLMLRLRDGTAQRQDVDATLGALQFASQVPDLRQTVLPLLVERDWLAAAQLDAAADRLRLAPGGLDGLLK